MNATVIGMGKIGLPLAVQFSEHINKVYGTDINQATIDLVNAGIAPFPNENALGQRLMHAVKSGKLIGSTDISGSITDSNVVVVVVPLILNSENLPDFRSLDAATEVIGSSLKRGTLVAYETTLPVGTTRNRFAKQIEKRSGLKAGKDFHIVFSPERVLTGRVFEDLKKYPKIIGGLTKECLNKGVDFYTKVLQFDERRDLSKPNGVWAVDSLESAEFVKLAETTYRDVNIALANEFAMEATRLGIKIDQVITAANSQTYSNIHTPGIAVGGHCIPVYPKLYMLGDKESKVVPAARLVNEGMPVHAINQIEKKIGPLEGLHILILGLTYRDGVKETAYSGSKYLLKELKIRNSIVYGFDSLMSDKEILEQGFLNLKGSENEISIAIIQVADEKFKKVIFKELKNLKILYDGRNMLDPEFKSRKFLIMNI